MLTEEISQFVNCRRNVLRLVDLRRPGEREILRAKDPTLLTERCI